MMTKVLTPNAEQGYITGFAVSPRGCAEADDEEYLVLVAIPRKDSVGFGKLEVYDPNDLRVLFVES